MNRKDIEAEAYKRFPVEHANFEMMQHSNMMRDCFISGAEWMRSENDSNPLYHKADMIRACVKIADWVQEQTIEQARNAFCRYCQFDCKGHPHDDCTLLQEYVQTIKEER